MRRPLGLLLAFLAALASVHPSAPTPRWLGQRVLLRTAQAPARTLPLSLTPLAETPPAPNDVSVASALVLEVVKAAPRSPRRGAKRAFAKRVGSVLLAPFGFIRFIRASSSAASEARELLQEACVIDSEAAPGGSAECRDEGTLRNGMRELRSMLFRTARTVAGGGPAAESGVDGGSEMQAGWEERGKGSAFSRTLEVWRFLLAAVVKVVRANKAKGKSAAELSAAKTASALFVRDGLLRLGPTFIKLGQVVSTRPDILAPEYIAVLRSLQDDVPGFSGARAREIVSAELGRPLGSVFADFSDSPVAAASLGQVHAATLLDGTRVAVKVQRAGLRELFDLDLKNLKVLALLLDKLDPKSDGADREWAKIYDESARLLYLEIDYANEAANAQRFASNFAGQPEVRVPRVYPALSSPRLLTMEFVTAVKLTDNAQLEAMGLDRRLLSERVAGTFLQQLLRDGFFHCDPHPGNLQVDAEGRLVFFDFGMMDELSPDVRDGFRGFCAALFGGGPFVSELALAQSAQKLVGALGQMGVLSRTADVLAVEKLARFFIRRFKQAQLGSSLGAKDIKATLGNDLRTLTEEAVFRFPPTFTFIFRAFASVDGIGKGLDPSYDLGKLAQPFVEDFTAAATSPLQKLGKATGLNSVDIEDALTSPRKVAYLERTLRAMEQGSLKIRVRALENERSLERLAAQQDSTQAVVLAVAALNVAGVLSGALATQAAYAAAVFFAAQAAQAMLRVRSLDKKNLLYSQPAFQNAELPAELQSRTASGTES